VPGQPTHREIMTLLRFYLGYESEADLEMHVRVDLMPRPALEPGRANLGFTAQLEASARLAAGASKAITRVRLGRWNGTGEANA
jgi:type VI secretion system protein ImpH